MSAIRLTVLGAGSVRCAIPVIASLASYFGERPLEITFWDADEERLDLFDRFARLCFLLTDSTHTLKSTTSLTDALAQYDRILLQTGRNCVSKAGKATMDNMFVLLSLTDAPLLSLSTEAVKLPYGFADLRNWPPTLTDLERLGVPHQILRFLNGEEYPYSSVREYDRSPIKRWLDDPASIPKRKRTITF
jgi:hypothetical protein